MNGIPVYYGQSYPSIDPRRAMEEYSQDTNMADPVGAIDNSTMGGQQTLDQIISHNNQEMMRRRSMYQPQYGQGAHTEIHIRRASMMEFSATRSSDLAEFQFDPNPVHAAMSNQLSGMIPSSKPLDAGKARSQDDLSLDIQFSQMPDFEQIPNVSTYTPALMSSTPINLDATSSYLSHSMDVSMDFDSGTPQTALFAESTLTQTFPIPYAPNQDPARSSTSPQTPAQMSKISQPGMVSKPQPQQQPQPQPQQPQQRRRSRVIPNPLATASLDTNTIQPPHIQQVNQRRMSVADAQSPFASQGDCLGSGMRCQLTLLRTSQ
jgi:hypothetical protein